MNEWTDRKASAAADPTGKGRKGSKRASVAADDPNLTGTQRLQALKQKKQQRRAEELLTIENEEEEEEEAQISLLDRTDSELTPAEILQKDLMMYDLLMTEEDLMLMRGELKIDQDDEEEEEEELEDEDEGYVLRFRVLL